MHFFRFSHAGLLVLAVIYNFAMVAAQENSEQVSQINDAVDLTESKVAEISSTNESATDKEDSTEVPSSTSSSNKASTQKTVTTSSKILPAIQNDNVKDPSCVLLDLKALLLFKVSQKNDTWAEYALNSSSADQFHGCPYNADLKQPRIVGFMGPSFSLNLTAKQRTDGSRWYIGTIVIIYNPIEEVFKDKTFDKYEEVKTSSDEYFMETPMDKSFSCSEPRSIVFYNNRGKLVARMVVKSIQMQIYNIPKDGKFSPEFQCGESLAQPVPTDLQDTVYRSETVPIVVGSCLAVITVLVIAGYAAYRSLMVKKLEYATMEE